MSLAVPARIRSDSLLVRVAARAREGLSAIAVGASLGPSSSTSHLATSPSNHSVRPAHQRPGVSASEAVDGRPARVPHLQHAARA